MAEKKVPEQKMPELKISEWKMPEACYRKCQIFHNIKIYLFAFSILHPPLINCTDDEVDLLHYLKPKNGNFIDRYRIFLFTLYYQCLSNTSY
jgi:hypothetical protein